MLTPRNMIALTVSIATISILWSAFSLLRPPDSDGMRGDSYGTHLHGHRALYDTLKELGVPVRRSIGPPTMSSLGKSVLVLWSPSHEIVQFEQKWLEQVAEWVRGGGQVVIASQPSDAGFLSRLQDKVDRDEKEKRRRLRRITGGDGDSGLPSKSLTELLGLPGVTITRAGNKPQSDQPAVPTESQPPESPPSQRGGSSRDQRPQPVIGDVVREVFGVGSINTTLRKHTLRATGTLQPAASSSSVVALPEGDLNEIHLSGTTPSGELFARGDDGDDVLIAARFDVGQGTVTLLSTPAMITNGSVAAGDNILLAARLLAVSDRELVFDEFYHGLTFRGNAMWLFAQRTYGSVTLALLLAMGLLVWRSSVFLGDPLAERSVSRRSIREHVEAMSRFLREGPGHAAWILPRVRDGLLWRLRHEHGLPPEQKHSDAALLAAVERRDPERAVELTDVLAAINEHLRAGSTGDQKRSVTLLRRMTACLSKNATARSAKKSRKSFTAKTKSSTSP